MTTFDPKPDAAILAAELADMLYDEATTEAVGGKTKTIAKMQVMLAEVFTTMANGFTLGVEKEAAKIAGYQPQSDAKVALVNSFKQDEERLLRKLDELRDGPKVVAVDDTPPIAPGEWRDVQVFEPATDPRWLAIARTGFETAFMALNRAVFQPQRISLPEDADEGTPAASALGQVNE